MKSFENLYFSAFSSLIKYFVSFFPCITEINAHAFFYVFFPQNLPNNLCYANYREKILSTANSFQLLNEYCLAKNLNSNLKFYYKSDSIGLCLIQL